jgi:hypothetical protein
MTEQAAAPAAEKTETVKCGHATSSGPCIRPLGHTANGHMSKAARDKKTSNRKGTDMTPEAMAAREAERAAKAAERIKAAEDAHAAKLAKLEAAAAEFGMKLVPMTKAELKAHAAAEKAAAQGGEGKPSAAE